MAKILISSIGVGGGITDYAKANYKIDDKIYKDEKFIAKALCEHIGIDKLFLVGTKKSIWEAVYQDFGGNYELGLKILEAKENDKLDEFLPIIEQIIDTKLGTKGSKCFVIKYGLDDDELWQNFDKFLQIANNFAKNDEIYMDITHSFRSLSLMSFVMSEFVSNSLDDELDIKGVYYGMLEYSKENNGITPIVNLSMFFELLKWSKAIRELKKYGNAKEILMLLQKSNDEVGKDVLNKFKSFSDSLSMSDITYIQLSINQLKTRMAFFKNNHNNIYRLISKDLEKFIDIFNVSSPSLLQYKMAIWYYESKNYSMAYIFLTEAFLTAVAENNNTDLQTEEKQKKVKKIINKRANNNTHKKNTHKKDNEYDIYFKIKNIRHSIAHALDLENRKTKITPREAIENLPLYIEKVKVLFKDKN
ncbi:TIGR02221 family CRISPR-associated protein [Campylobacter gastrosuis]|uniref:TIGR02221 family CRISPR-associated protein n=1 Tax=Campylobacter gastrosuis TaxID=2974576 RepID=A0ABT7HS48_9BACT|nr:TIGR02221 family CRISPR-associated protein [Campylobacter gastrosuis]MDL0089649.1 TIGR02221 family CRISPR-associated protein [Campylobacter gastrosuis]